ncbi:ABC transporter ATP-binding protein, partial [Intestinimonas butyriciproducens]|uniref:ABC transporter ATP-binding protein n=1 Tax=Intestinimonas butyriciproducens TaxID=1297617 RepID=UPI00195C195F
MLDIRDLRFSYTSRPVLQGVDLRLEPGELVFLLGANGAGKSTLFRCALGLLPGYEGEISLHGRDIRRLSARALAREMAYIPQSHHPAFSYPVLDMVLMGAQHRLSPFANPGPREEAAALAALDQVGIAGLAGRDFQRLSGGEQQLVLIARALAQQARLLLMDEPTSSLDFGNRVRVLDQVSELARRGYAILLSCHDPQLALLYAHRVVALHQGKVAADGPPEAVLDPALLHTLYQ